MAVLIRREEIDKSLHVMPHQGKHLVAIQAYDLGIRVTPDCPIKILEDCNVSDNPAEVHDNEDDIWLCLEGTPTFTYGGELFRPERVKEHEWKAKEIRGGITVTLKPGDWLWIPAFTPHQHNCPDGVARMVIIKVTVK